MKLQWILIIFFEVLLYNQSDCLKLNITTIDGKYEEEMKITVNALTEIVVVYPSINVTNPFRIITSSPTANKQTPILVVVRQEKYITSWQLPTVVETSKKDQYLYFWNASKTMCHDHMDSIISVPEFSSGPLIMNQSFIVAISTASGGSVSVSLKVQEEKNFYVKLDTEYSLRISPSEPKYVYFSYTNDVSDTVIIKVDSEDDVCFTVSVQDSVCPVLDTNKDITYEGYYQTVTTKGAITINTASKVFPYGFFLVFVAKPDNYDCGQEKSLLPIPRSFRINFANRTSELSFQITNSINYREYAEASIFTLAVLGVFGILVIAMHILATKFGTLRKASLNKMDQLDVRGNVYEPYSDAQIENMLRSKNLKLKTLAQFPIKDKRRSFNYLWHIMSIAIFYSIPVVQLVVTYQRVVNQTGNQDMCYYNFLCAHPKFGFSDFNHLYSNIGYVVIGLFYLFNVLYRHIKIPLRFEIGIPVHYGLFYAMGIALIIEGLLSASYHICPSQSNYQFDTSFMYIMAVLCMVKLYQNRHPDINASAYATFSVLGSAIFVAMVGILNGTLLVWIIFVLMYSGLCIYLSFKIYFMSYIFKGFKEFVDDYKEQGFSKDTFAPIRKVRFLLLTIVNILNYIMLITGLVMYNSGITDFGTFLLGILMGNAIIHVLFYTTMKLINKEKICFEAIIYGILMILSWGAATFFFLDAATLWTVTPAESREWNQGCIVMNFYDKHDVWHLLSAPALYFTFMFLLTLDDDLINQKQGDIVVF